ncbi:pyruvate dehydrogenase (acetyl-transferring) E1 component subunit alpha [Agrococcus sp. HG114]|uniref:pyruvate dehydrogenase (acetyl-transferring) E1 component subunit alpha n=1 Tax=Agrococcus sp. HG114 TaxID=2969757 RepID=UPI00215B3C2E|nr:pyruvate dehydrogenase (acetyl-transferring) E1 component subunit alpha [Agrococcus sp. HG114]MCR8670120.1 pyruvate dehydrogenase (acetyl-transferring) E1 component subunit alpha [Agrococcus sp. HG114]
MSITVPAPDPALALGLDCPLRVIDLDGTRLSEPTLDPHLADIDETALADLYVDMVRVRRLDTEAFALTRQGHLVLWPPLLGQEAAQVGAARALEPRDWVFGSYREHGFALLRGADMSEFARIWKAYAHGGWDPHEINMAPSQIIIGAQSLHGVGYAMAAKMDGSDDVALTAFGDGATSEGDVNEALVWASAFQAPVVFLCQNNQYAISEPVRVQSGVPLALRPTGFGIPSMRVDGNDVLAMLAAGRVAVERARAGHGPTFIEAVTYRRGPHTTTDDPKRYRDEAEVEEWTAKDPIDRVERALERMGANVEAVRAEAKIRADRLAKEFRAAAEHAEPPTADAIFDNVYVQPTRRLERQRAEHRAFVASLAEGAK